MVKNVKRISSSFLMALTLATPQLSHAMEEEDHRPQEITSLVVRQAAYEQCLEDNTSPTLDKTLCNLALVCKEWHALIHDEMKVGTPSWKAWYGVVGHEDSYQQFLKMTLIYLPAQEGDEGAIQFQVSDLLNPLEGEFDLSQCGGMGKNLSISTGYRKEIKSENKDKMEIWFAPRFMIEKHLKSTASHYEPIMDTWVEETAPFGILWNWGIWKEFNRYDSLTSSGPNAISSKDLFKNWSDSKGTDRCFVGHGPEVPTGECFMFICEPKHELLTIIQD